MAREPAKPFPLIAQPGVKRDGTQLEGNAYIEALWCRFQRGRPRKMGGWREMSNSLSGPVRGCYIWSRSGLSYVFSGSSGSLEYIQVDPAGMATAPSDYTPAALVTSADNVWQFDAMWNAGGANTALIAHAAQNLTEIDNATPALVYYGPIDGSGSMATTTQSVSGGAVVLPPYLMLYGSDGQVIWSDANSPATYGSGDSGAARVTGAKIVNGLRIRGGPANSPSGLLWALDSLIRASYVGGTAIFGFDTVSGQTSVLSSSAMIEFDGLFFWPGVDRFYVYNGVIQEVQNDYNINYFYDNLNQAYRQKVWATKVTRFGEIWFFYPHGDSTECNNAIIYNVREKSWYDAGVGSPGSARSSGYFSQVLRFPTWFGTEANNVSKYQAFQQESGTDAVIGGASNAIRSYFETPDMSFLTEGPMQSQHIGEDRNTSLDEIDLDFVQTGDMTVTYLSRKFPRSPDVSSSETFTATDEVLRPRVQGRFLRLRFESNVAGGNYQMGKPILHIAPGDRRP